MSKLNIKKIIEEEIGSAISNKMIKSSNDEKSFFSKVSLDINDSAMLYYKIVSSKEEAELVSEVRKKLILLKWNIEFELTKNGIIIKPYVKDQVIELYFQKEIPDSYEYSNFIKEINIKNVKIKIESDASYDASFIQLRPYEIELNKDAVIVNFKS